MAKLKIKDLIPGEKYKLLTELKLEEEKLQWMVSTQNEQYDETEFKVWNILKTLSSKSTDEEKAKVIARLINQR